MNLNLPPEAAAKLGESVGRLAHNAGIIASLGEADPGLAQECGIELGSLETRMILLSGAIDRVARTASEALRLQKPVALAAADMEAVSRLEKVVAQSRAQIDIKAAAMDAAASQEPAARMGNLISLATGAVGLAKMFF